MVFSAFILCFFGLSGMTCQEAEKAVEADGEWKVLFDGETLTGWKPVKEDGHPEKGWTVQNGILTIGSNTDAGDIITGDQFSSFELELEFNITPGANSGIKYFVQPGTSLGLEYQILDDDRHPDAREGVGGNRTVASLYDLIPPENKQVNPPGEWNKARILVRGDHVEHWLNGTKVVGFNRRCQTFRALIQKSKYSDIGQFGQLEKGHLLLQDHGDEVSFRNIRLRVIGENIK